MTAQLTPTEFTETTENVAVDLSDAKVLTVETDKQSAVVETWRQAGGIAAQIIAELPAYTVQFYRQYRSLLTITGWLFAALIGVKLLAAVLGTINDVALAQPFFELVGLGYSAWFINRYLLTDSKRQDLLQQIRQVRQQVLG